MIAALGEAIPLWVLPAAVAVLVLISWIAPGFRAGVWSPTPRDVVDAMLELCVPAPGEHLFDLGFGDGRFLLTAARRYGLRATGFDLNPLWHVWVGGWARLLGLSDRIRLFRADLFQADLREADIVTVFLSPAVADRLAEKLVRELRPGARVVTYQVPFPEWSPRRVAEPRSGKHIYYYVVSDAQN